MKIITSITFLNAFKIAFKTVSKDKGFNESNPYNINGLAKWTEMMLNMEDGVMHSILENINNGSIQYKREIYTVDGLFISNKKVYEIENGCYPQEIYVLIEHELGEAVEEEMWKLIFWRAPLKVLIMYDWGDDERQNEKKRRYITEKLENMLTMLDKVNSFYKENEATEYLFLVGCRKDINSCIYWKYTTNKTGIELKLLETILPK